MAEEARGGVSVQQIDERLKGLEDRLIARHQEQLDRVLSSLRRPGAAGLAALPSDGSSASAAIRRLSSGARPQLRRRTPPEDFLQQHRQRSPPDDAAAAARAQPSVVSDQNSELPVAQEVSSRQQNARVSFALLERESNMTGGDVNARKSLRELITDEMRQIMEEDDIRDTHTNLTLPATLRGQASLTYKARRVILSSWFDLLCGVAIVMNAFVIGAEIEYQAQNGNQPSQTLQSLQLAFGIFFLIELLLRIYASRWDFLGQHNWKANFFDVILVSTFVVDFLLNVSGDSEKKDGLSTSGVGRVLRTVRFCRILRTLRLFRVTAYAREFRKMAYALQHSAHTLFWAVLLLVFVMYCFATTFTQAASDFLEDFGDPSEEPELVQQLRLSYGTLPRSFYSLFCSVSTGINWNEAVRPLSECHWFFVSLFIFYITVTLFGVMNVVTAVFVDSALQSTEKYKDIKIQEALTYKKIHVQHLRDVFSELDSDGSGEICAEEMSFFLQDPHMSNYLNSIDIHTEDAVMLFQLLDRDDSGHVSIDEFCTGCMRLKGEAKSFDIHCLIYENEKIVKKFTDVLATMDKNFDAIKEQLQRDITRVMSMSVQGAREEIKSIVRKDVAIVEEVCQSI